MPVHFNIPNTTWEAPFSRQVSWTLEREVKASWGSLGQQGTMPIILCPWVWIWCVYSCSPFCLDFPQVTNSSLELYAEITPLSISYSGSGYFIIVTERKVGHHIYRTSYICPMTRKIGPRGQGQERNCQYYSGREQGQMTRLVFSPDMSVLLKFWWQ